MIKLLIGFLALAILSFSLIGIGSYIKGNFDSLDNEGFIKFSILLLIVVILFIALINYIVGEVL